MNCEYCGDPLPASGVITITKTLAYHRSAMTFRFCKWMHYVRWAVEPDEEL